MTDKKTHEVTNEDRRLAREWAEHVESSRATWGDRFRAAARVILNDIPAPPPTLADMTMEERYACRWMQCDVRNAKITHGVIANNHGGNTHVLDAEGEVWYLPPTDITPRPDLPRMTWPGEKPAPALPEGWWLADHPDYGRVIVTTEKPDGDGYVYFTFPDDDVLGYEWHFCRPEELAYLDTTSDVPESTLAVGSVWGDADALARACEETGRDQIVILDSTGDAYVWDKEAEWWESSAPPRFTPFTIIHDGKKDDQ